MIRRGVLGALVLAIGIGAGPAAAAAAVDARVVGTFAMVAHVTTAVNVRGEHRGQTLHRSWRVTPAACSRSICRRLVLHRQRSAGIVQRVTLRRVGAGRYSGSGVFYVALRCKGRTYLKGSRAPFGITVTVAGTVTVQGIRFARRLRGTYVNPSRSDATPCPLGPSHDAARYSGSATSPAPGPPSASFTTDVAPGADSAQFSSTSQPGAGGASIVAYAWNFGDPASGRSDTSTASAPAHRFSQPGSYRVTLTVTDENGLASSVTQLVTVPGAISSVSRTRARSVTSRPADSRAGWTTA